MDQRQLNSIVGFLCLFQGWRKGGDPHSSCVAGETESVRGTADIQPFRLLVSVKVTVHTQASDILCFVSFAFLSCSLFLFTVLEIVFTTDSLWLFTSDPMPPLWPGPHQVCLSIMILTSLSLYRMCPGAAGIFVLMSQDTSHCCKNALDDSLPFTVNFLYSKLQNNFCVKQHYYLNNSTWLMMDI